MLENGVPSGKIGPFLTYLLFEFIRGTKAAEASRNICTVYGDNVIRENMARKWFSLSKENRFDISDTPHSERPSRFDEDRLNTLTLCDRMLPLTTTPTYQLAVKVPRSTSPSRKLPECHPYNYQLY